MADIFREVDEELRRENLEKLWKKHGRTAIGLAVAVVLGVAAAQAWRTYELSQRQKLSDRFAEALATASSGDEAAALDALAELSDPGRGGYRGLAAFEQARVLAETGDVEGAIAIWDRIAANGDLGPGFQAVATLLSVLHQMDRGDPEALRQRLAPLAEEGAPFRATARELLALLALREGDRGAARDLYTKIADDREAPSGLRARATQMLAAIKE
ncbi:MAG: tetratricopeptide repeat protein [Kiloniellaceae bacterium]